MNEQIVEKFIILQRSDMSILNYFKLEKHLDAA